MIKKRKSVRALASTFGLALIAALAFSAVGATASQAASTWNVDGVAYTGGESFATSGTFALNVPGFGLEVTCKDSGTGTATSSANVKELSASLKSCAVSGPEGKVCTVSGLNSIPNRNGSASGTVSGASFSFEIQGGECPFMGKYAVPSAGFGLKFGSEAVNLPVTATASVTIEAQGTKEPATLSESGAWEMTGAHKGHVWSFGPTPPPPSKTWKIEGKSFSGEESFYTSGTFALNVPGFGLEVTCSKEVGGAKTAGYAYLYNLSGSLKFCAVSGPEGKVCTVSGLNTIPGRSGNVGGTLSGAPFSFEIQGGECSFQGHYTVPNTGFSLKFGSEAVTPTVTATAAETIEWEGVKEAATLSESGAWEMTGAHKGQKWTFS
jgi:hypothetical protein